MSKFIKTLLANFETIEFVGVIGNHGRLSARTYNAESNMDRMLYTILEHIFADEPRIKFNIPDGHGERSFWAVDKVGNLSTLLVHGDQFSSPTSSYSYMRKILGWKAGAIPVKFDEVFMGHYHQNTKFSFGNVVVRISGSPESDNTFAQEVIGHMSRPSQHLQFISPARGIVTAEYDVWLD